MKFLLIDGNSVLFRGFYATCYGSIMKTSFGVYTNAVYAFSNMMEKAIKLINPDYCVVAFDKGKHTFRHEIAEDYKGGRKPTPEELVGQFALVREMLDAYNIKYLEFDDIEADDIIGSIAKKYDFETCIFSSDHDLLQLIDKTTSVYMMKKGMSDIAKLDEEALFNEYQLKPFQIIEFKGLAGDSSDNIHGVEGIGEKTATKLLNDYDSCEGIYEHIEEIKGKLKEKLINGKESCFISKKLATIKTDVPIDYDLDFFKFNLNRQSANDFFKKYEMRSLIKEIEIKVNDDIDYSLFEVNKISHDLYDDPFIHFMSDEIYYYENELKGLCFKTNDKCEYISKDNLLKDNETLDFLKSDKKKCVFDYKAKLHISLYNFIELGKCDDVLLMSSLANNYNNNLENILSSYGYELPILLKDIYQTKDNNIDHNKELLYATMISKYLKDIYEKLKDELKEKEILSLYEDVELPLSYVLFKMENNGIICDKEELNIIAQKTLKLLNKLEKDIYNLVNKEFNINSPKQLKEILFTDLDLPDIKKGSTSADVLEKLVDYHPIIQNILDYRKYSKLYSSYAEGLKRFIGEDNRIHTIYSQTIVQTGRLSSFDPNLQNISVRDEEGKEIRRTFKPAKNCVLISSDYSQIELRVLAHLANETKMIEAFNSGVDIHTKTAMDIFKVSEDEVSDTIRRNAKAVNFGVVYGISDFGLSEQTGLSFKDSKKFINDYFETYPNIKNYLDNQVAFCLKNGYVKTILNRRRYIKEINDRNFMVKEFGKRAAMNSTVQGSAADIIKLAMLNIDKKIEEKHLKSKMLLQVHDELIFEVPNEEIEIMKDVINSGMSNAYKLNVKLDSSFGIGDNWLECK